eukprot:COSAG02_NODE_9778_length_2113_cov_1.573982_3_plen_76_part_00
MQTESFGSPDQYCKTDDAYLAKTPGDTELQLDLDLDLGVPWDLLDANHLAYTKLNQGRHAPWPRRMTLWIRGCRG